MNLLEWNLHGIGHNLNPLKVRIFRRLLKTSKLLCFSKVNHDLIKLITESSHHDPPSAYLSYLSAPITARTARYKVELNVWIIQTTVGELGRHPRQAL